MPTLRTTAYEFGPYRLDPLARSLLRRDELVSLPPKAVEVLVQLVKRPGTVIDKQELMQAVWRDTFVEEANLSQMIFLLRRALGNGTGSEYIATVPRRGYRFQAGVRTVEIPCRIASLAVLPLANLNGDPEQDFFTDGITEAVIAELAKIASLRVVSRASVMRYKKTMETVAQIARTLRVQAVLQGSAMKSGDRLRITAQLVHATSEQPLWTETYEASLCDILGLQRKLVCDVAAAACARVSQD